MALINVSLDTATKQTVLTINGVMVPVTDLMIEKFISTEGKEIVRFMYTVETVNADGLKENRRFFLPQPEDTIAHKKAKLDKNGLMSYYTNDTKAKNDTISFLKNLNKK